MTEPGRTPHSEDPAEGRDDDARVQEPVYEREHSEDPVEGPDVTVEEH